MEVVGEAFGVVVVTGSKAAGTPPTGTAVVECGISAVVIDKSMSEFVTEVETSTSSVVNAP